MAKNATNAAAANSGCATTIATKKYGDISPRPSNDSYRRIYAVVRRIPRGRVASYGQVAALAGLPGHARQVGYALHALTLDKVPWQRVVNAAGAISARSEPRFEEMQRGLLEREGVIFDANGRIPLSRFQWRPALSPRR